jgi:hypothetical protein
VVLPTVEVDSRETPAPARRNAHRRLPWWGWTLLVAAAIIVAVGALGGFGDVPVQKVPRIELGETRAGVEIDVRVDEVAVTDVRPGTGNPAPEGSRFLVVEALLVNTGTSPTFLLDDSIRLVADRLVGVDDDPDSVVEARRGEPLTFLQPGLPTSVAYLWEVPTGAALPEEVVVGILERYRVSDDLIFDDAYGAPTAVARVVTGIEGGAGA